MLYQLSYKDFDGSWAINWVTVTVMVHQAVEYFVLLVEFCCGLSDRPVCSVVLRRTVVGVD